MSPPFLSFLVQPNSPHEVNEVFLPGTVGLPFVHPAFFFHSLSCIVPFPGRHFFVCLSAKNKKSLRGFGRTPPTLLPVPVIWSIGIFFSSLEQNVCFPRNLRSATLCCSRSPRLAFNFFFRFHYSSFKNPKRAPSETPFASVDLYSSFPLLSFPLGVYPLFFPVFGLVKKVNPPGAWVSPPSSSLGFPREFSNISLPSICPPPTPLLSRVQKWTSASKFPHSPRRHYPSGPRGEFICPSF